LWQDTLHSAYVASVLLYSEQPLCAAYVKYDYNGEDALNNPIFMKTNYVLAVGWGILLYFNSDLVVVFDAFEHDRAVANSE